MKRILWDSNPCLTSKHIVMGKLISMSEAKERGIKPYVFNGQVYPTKLYSAGDIVSFEPNGQKYKVMPKRACGKDKEVMHPLLPIGGRVPHAEYIPVGREMIKHD